MPAKKPKSASPKLGAKLSNKLTALHGINLYAPAFFGILAIGLVTFLQPVPAQTHINTVNTANKVTHQSPAPVKTAPPAAAAPTPAPSPVVAPPPAKPTIQAGTPKAEPVVTPSPNSSVSGLAPTTPPPAAPTPTTPQAQQPPPQVTTGYTSTNWSGYLAASGNFTSVSGSWNATMATGNGVSTSADSTWIGIGGVTTGDLIQTGTMNIISASGQVSTAAFYEMLPAASIPITSMTVSPGDSISANITEVGSGQWTINITDTTNGQTFSITVSYASSHSSAEWIEEDPSYSFRRQIPFANFHLASFWASSAVDNGVTVNLNTSTAQPVIMVNQAGHPIATPSVITGGGTSFTVSP